MVFRHVYIFPILLAIWYPATFIATYIMAVSNEDVVPIFPYISDTGTWSPESCVFGLMLNMGSILMAITVYVRYRQLRDLCERNSFDDFVPNWNKRTFYMGLTATFGVVIVGNFQETNAFFVHCFGAGLCFGLGYIYMGIQARISFMVYPILGNKVINSVRAVLALMCALTFNSCTIFGGLSYLKFTGEDITKWTKEDGGWTFHLISTITEWILAICTMFYLTSFSGEFSKVQFEEPEISFKN